MPAPVCRSTLEQIARFHVYFPFVEAAAVVTKQTSEFSLNVNSTKSTEEKEEEEESSWSERRVLQLMMISPTLLPRLLTYSFTQQKGRIENGNVKCVCVCVFVDQEQEIEMKEFAFSVAAQLAP